MTNRNHAKGMSEERAVLGILRTNGFPHSERTRSGRLEDQGDIFVTRTTGLTPGVIAQVKHCRTPLWSEWMEQLALQKARSGALIAFLTHRVTRRGGKPPIRLAIMPLDDFCTLLRAAGHGDTLEETA